MRTAIALLLLCGCTTPTFFEDRELDADGDGVLPAGGDCDDREPAAHPGQPEVWGVGPACAPLVYPGFPHEFPFARVSLPSYFQDPVSGDLFLFFRGHEAPAE